MIFWLDWKLFGNGRGFGSPFWDDKFYWLSGRFYHWIGGFGAQLHSVEWRTPKPGTRRRLFDHEFVVYLTSRRGPRVMVSWALTREPKDYSEITALRHDLETWNGYPRSKFHAFSPQPEPPHER